MTEVLLDVHGKLLPGLTRKRLLAAARHCVAAAQRWSRPDVPWQEVTVHLIHDALSAEVNAAIMNHEGPTDVITQAYDPLPGEAAGLIGELYVNLDEAARVSARLKRTTLEEETVLYIAHGCDHLTGEEDTTPDRRAAMRKRDLRWMHAALKTLD